MSFSFEGKRILVTGAGRGLGRAIVESFVKSGGSVFALDIKQELLDDVTKSFPTVVTAVIDLSKWDEVKEIVQKLGPMDHLVNNAGVFIYEPILEATESAVDKVLSVNFKAVLNMCQIFAKNVIQNEIKGATIVNVSSLAGQRPYPVGTQHSGTIYSCSKAAVDMLTKNLAVEFAQYDIRVNGIAPGPMITGLMDNLPPDVRQGLKTSAIKARQLVPGVAELDDVAFIALYLSSPVAKFITGSINVVDGGVGTA
ncbi:L-xylulose reductase [Folsomia candida]|nr:L-xylulose reductase [Folsomia candida]